MTMIANKTRFGHPTKRRKKTSSSPSSSDWSGLHTDLWESILNRLSVADLLRVRAVCHSWCSLAKARISSLESPLFDESPLMLMLPSDHEANQIDRQHCLYNPTEKKVYKQLMMNIPEDLGHTDCVGSSHGWLIFFDNQKSIPYMFSPFLEVWLQFPLFPVIHIEKAILSSDPIHSDNNNYFVVVIYGLKSNLAFSKCGDTDWTTLSDANQHYCDIISYHHHIYALAENGSVEIWDFNSSIPVQKMEIKPSFPEKNVEFENSLGDGLYYTQSYMVESNDDFLLIIRYIGYLVREDGVLVHEADLLDDEQKQYLIRPFITKLFHVYKMDFNSEKWVRLDSLGDHCMLFLGRNQSVSLPSKSFPSCKANSIYFTDDYWDQMDEHDMYGGHDTGRFDLEDHSIELINEDSDEDDLQKIELLPIWLVPNPR